MKFTPRDYQHASIDHLIDVPRCNLWAGMGTGKTVSTLTALDRLSLVEDVFPALVLAPKRVARKGWANEAKKWDHLQHLRTSAVIGDADERRAGLRASAEIYTINYDNLEWLGDQLNGKWPFRTVVADESTKLKGFRVKQGAVRAKVLAKPAHASVTRWINLTGTPSSNGLSDLWGQAWFLDGGKRLGMSFESFRQRWFQRSFDGYSIDPLPFAQEQIMEKLRDVSLSIDAADYMDLPPVVSNVVYVDLPKKAMATYREMERELFTEIEGHGIEALNAASKTIKCLQIANGAIYIDDKRKAWEKVHDEKLDALEDIIEEASGAPVLVAYNFRHDLERLLKRFPKGRDLGAREKDLDAFIAGKIQIGFAHPKSMGHGIDGMQDRCNTIAFFGHDWNLEDRLQMIERIGPVRQVQAGKNRTVYVHDIIARGTLEGLVLERVDSKREVQDLVLDYMKRRKG